MPAEAVETDILGAAGIALASMAHGHADSPKATDSLLDGVIDRW
jgi:hypothetical protein